jgi:hypothetical protein
MPGPGRIDSNAAPDEFGKSRHSIVPASGLNLPGFKSRPSLPAGYIPVSVATGDFNGDGKMDWVVCNGGDNDLWIYLGSETEPGSFPLFCQWQVWLPFG